MSWHLHHVVPKGSYMAGFICGMSGTLIALGILLAWLVVYSPADVPLADTIHIDGPGP